MGLWPDRGGRPVTLDGRCDPEALSENRVGIYATGPGLQNPRASEPNRAIRIQTRGAFRSGSPLRAARGTDALLGAGFTYCSGALLC